MIAYQLNLFEPKYIWKCKCGTLMTIYEAAAHYQKRTHIPKRIKLT